MLFSLRNKLATVVGLVGLTALGLAGFTLVQMDREHERAMEVEAAWNGALQAQTLARAIEHAVVASHAVYTAEDKDDAKLKFQSLTRALEEIERLKEPFMSWLAATAPDKTQLLSGRLQEFLAYQRDTAELGTSVSPKAALIQATDEATIKSREMMVNAIMQLGDETKRSLETFQASADEARQQAKFVLMSLSFGSIILALIGAYVIATFQIRRPLQSLQRVMADLADHDLEVTVPFLTRRDEIGSMASSIATFQQALRDKRISDRRAAASMADSAERGARLERNAAAFEQRVHQVTHHLAQAAEQMDQVARSMRDNAQTTTRQVMSVAAGAEHASTRVKSTEQATKALSDLACSIGKQVNGAVAIATSALSELAKTDMTARSLTDATNEVGSVVELIAKIAAQTNLLALNATIEAARSGAAGRGFAVVAQEVKALASQTSQATDQISRQIGAIKSAADATVEAIAKTGQTIREINSIATVVAVAADEQQEATRRIAESVAGAATATREIANGIASVQTAAASSGATAENVLEASIHLADISRELNSEISEFLFHVRAA